MPSLRLSALPLVLLAAAAGAVPAAGLAQDPAPSQAPANEPPRVLRAAAISNTQVRVVFTEAVRTAEVVPGDFRLTMANTARTVTAVAAGESAEVVVLTATPNWQAGEAGTIALVDGVPDAEGNAAPAGDVRVFAAPGDAVAPVLTAPALSPRTICLRSKAKPKPRPTGNDEDDDAEGETGTASARRCATRTILRFTLDEDARVTVTFARTGIKRRVTLNAKTGANRFVFDRRTSGFRLTRGRWGVILRAEDAAGNASRNTRLQGYLNVAR